MTDPVKIIVGEGDITEVNVPEYGIIQTGGGGGGGGSDGATFFPEVSQEGVISWTNDGGYDNPDPVNIKGPAGNDGSDGEDGDDGTTFTPAVDASGNLSWTNDGGKQNPQTVNIKGPQGDAGQGVPAGGTTGQVLAKASNADYVTEWVDQSGGGGGTSDYDDLTDKPSINNVTLSGNKTAAELRLGTYTKPSGGIPQTDLASAVQNKLDETVVVSDTQPTASENKLWVDTDAGTGASYQIPTVAEMDAADAANAANISALRDRFPTTLYNDFNALENVYQPVIFKLNPNSQHAPNNAAFVCIQYASSANYAVQLAFRSGATDIFMRAKASGTWEDWKSLTLS